METNLTIRNDKPAVTNSTWGFHINGFLNEYRGDTKKNYRDGLNQFLKFANISLEGDFRHIPDEFLVKAYRQDLLNRNKSPYTVNVYLAVVRSFYRYIKTIIRANLMAGLIKSHVGGRLNLMIDGVLEVKNVRASNNLSKLPLTIKQAKELMNSIGTEKKADIRDRAMIALFLGCGVRRIEVARALRGDLKVNGKYLLYIQQKGHHQKDSFVVIEDEILVELKRWLKISPGQKPEDPLFPSLKTGQPILPRVITPMIRTRLRAIGLNEHSVHSLRHTFATIALGYGNCDVRDVQQALGHASVQTTERYIHHSTRMEGNPERAVAELVF